VKLHALGCALVTAGVAAHAAAAHDEPAGRHGYISTVVAIAPNVLGLQARVLGGDERLTLRNWSGKTVVVLGYHGEPFLRFTDHGVFRLAGAEWRRVAGGTSYAWHDHRIHWDRKTPPPAVAAAPDRPHKLFGWRIPGRADGRRFVITGFLGYAPPPAVSHGRSWWPTTVSSALAVLLAVVLLRRRRGSAARAGGGPSGG